MRGGGALARAHAVRRVCCRAATRPTPAAPRCATRSAAPESARRAATRVNSRAPQKLAQNGSRSPRSARLLSRGSRSWAGIGGRGACLQAGQ